MFSLSKNESDILIKLKNITLNFHNVEQILLECRRISPLIDDFEFPYIYSGTLLAAEGKLTESIKILKNVNYNCFAKVVRDYIETFNTFTPQVQVFLDNRPYTSWTKTNFAQNYISNTIEAVSDFYKSRQNKNCDCLTVLDIGTGNGILISKIINSITKKKTVKKVKLILLDKFSDMLESAEAYCRSNISGELEIHKMLCEINNISYEQIKEIKEFSTVNFINCALSIHHFPWEVKLKVLKLIRNISAYCFISEVNFNHDLNDKYSPELIFAVSVNMHCIFKDILESPITDQEKKLAIEQFFLAEAINIVKNERLQRIDFHTKIRHWKELAEKSGFNVSSIIPTVKYENRIAAFTMMLEN